MSTISQINEFTYSLKIKGDYTSPLYNTIQKLIKTSHYDHETNTMLFSAEKVTLFKQTQKHI